MSSIAMAADSTQTDVSHRLKPAREKPPRRHRRHDSTSSSSRSSSSRSDDKNSHTRSRKNNDRKKKAHKQKKSRRHYSSDEGSSDYEEDLDLSKDLLSIASYVRMKDEMVDHMFRSISRKKLRAMLPDILKQLDLQELKTLCIGQLEVMSKKRICRILDGADPELISSSGTEEDSSGQLTEDDADLEHDQVDSTLLHTPDPNVAGDQETEISVAEEHKENISTDEIKKTEAPKEKDDKFGASMKEPDEEKMEGSGGEGEKQSERMTICRRTVVDRSYRAKKVDDIDMEQDLDYDEEEEEEEEGDNAMRHDKASDSESIPESLPSLVSEPDYTCTPVLEDKECKINTSSPDNKDLEQVPDQKDPEKDPDNKELEQVPDSKDLEQDPDKKDLEKVLDLKKDLEEVSDDKDLEEVSGDKDVKNVSDDKDSEQESNTNDPGSVRQDSGNKVYENQSDSKDLEQVSDNLLDLSGDKAVKLSEKVNSPETKQNAMEQHDLVDDNSKNREQIVSKETDLNSSASSGNEVVGSQEVAEENVGSESCEDSEDSSSEESEEDDGGTSSCDDAGMVVADEEDESKIGLKNRSGHDEEVILQTQNHEFSDEENQGKKKKMPVAEKNLKTAKMRSTSIESDTSIADDVMRDRRSNSSTKKGSPRSNEESYSRQHVHPVNRRRLTRDESRAGKFEGKTESSDASKNYQKLITRHCPEGHTSIKLDRKRRSEEIISPSFPVKQRVRERKTSGDEMMPRNEMRIKRMGDEKNCDKILRQRSVSEKSDDVDRDTKPRLVRSTSFQQRNTRNETLEKEKIVRMKADAQLSPAKRTTHKVGEKEVVRELDPSLKRKDGSRESEGSSSKKKDGGKESEGSSSKRKDGSRESEESSSKKKEDNKGVEKNEPVLSKTQLEILELEMRARAIKAMLKAQEELEKREKQVKQDEKLSKKRKSVDARESSDRESRPSTREDHSKMEASDIRRVIRRKPSQGQKSNGSPHEQSPPMQSHSRVLIDHGHDLTSHRRIIQSSSVHQLIRKPGVMSRNFPTGPRRIVQMRPIERDSRPFVSVSKVLPRGGRIVSMEYQHVRSFPESRRARRIVTSHPLHSAVSRNVRYTRHDEEERGAVHTRIHSPFSRRRGSKLQTK